MSIRSKAVGVLAEEAIVGCGGDMFAGIETRVLEK